MTSSQERDEYRSRGGTFAPAAKRHVAPHFRLANQVGRNLAVLEALDRDHEPGVFRRGSDRIAPLRLVAVIRGQANVNVLAGEMTRPVRHLQHQARDSWCLKDQLGHLTQMPQQGSPQTHGGASEFVGISVAPVTLLAPRVAPNVISVRLPEAWLLLVLERYAAHPLGALPEIEVRHEQPHRPAVLWMKWLPVELVHDPRLVPGQVIERAVGRVPAVGENGGEVGSGFDPFEQLVDRDTGPRCLELRPFGYAVNVLGHGLAGQRAKLFPGPPLRFVDLARDGERPLVQRHARSGSGGEDGEGVDHVLPGRHARARDVVAPLAFESARDKTHYEEASRQSRGGPRLASSNVATSPGFGNRPDPILLNRSSPSRLISNRPPLPLCSSTTRMIGAQRLSTSVAKAP